MLAASAAAATAAALPRVLGVCPLPPANFIFRVCWAHLGMFCTLCFSFLGDFRFVVFAGGGTRSFRIVVACRPLRGGSGAASALRTLSPLLRPAWLFLLSRLVGGLKKRF